MKRPCLDCGELYETDGLSSRQQFDRGGRCPKHRSAINRAENTIRHARPSQRTYADPVYRAIPKPYGKRCALQIEGVCTGIATTWDAIVPANKGGTHQLSNLQPACRACNSSKCDKII